MIWLSWKLPMCSAVRYTRSVQSSGHQSGFVWVPQSIYWSWLNYVSWSLFRTALNSTSKVCLWERESALALSQSQLLVSCITLLPFVSSPAAFGRRKEKILRLAGAFSFAFTKLFQADLETDPPGTVLLFVCHGRLLLSAVENESMEGRQLKHSKA